MISASMGLISDIAILCMIYQTYRNGGEATPRCAAVVLVCLILSMIGMIVAILSRREPDRYYLFSYIGMVSNGLALAACWVIMYLGVA